MISIGNPLFQSNLVEYEGVVTQLAATSEVASIGFKFSVSEGERVRLLDLAVIISDISAGKTVQGRIRNTNANNLRTFLSASLDNNVIYLTKGVGDAQTGNTPGQVGVPDLPILGGGMDIFVDVGGTVDALATLTLRMLYESIKEKMIVNAVGSGISISGETHIGI